MRDLSTTLWGVLGGAEEVVRCVDFCGSGEVSSVFAVADFAAAAVGVAGAAIAELIGTRFGELPRASVSRRLSSAWFGWSIQPVGWTMPAAWDPIAGDYAAADGWIRLHTNAPHHRAAALSVLGVAADKDAVVGAVRSWSVEKLETAVVEAGGCAAAMRSMQAWKTHEQGLSVGAEPLLATQATDGADGLAKDVSTKVSRDTAWAPARERPLRGLRVLDLTRVLAGPVATRFLAGFGADVLRIDPPMWDEPAVVADVTLGKRCARLNLGAAADLARFRHLLGQADVLVHGYRADALERLGLDNASRRKIRPGLIDVCLNAYGWSGPWRNRRGFDSLVQMSSGIADTGMQLLGRNRPTPLPLQALDHATGYLLAAAAIRGVTQRMKSGRGFEARTSLARMADVLMGAPVQIRVGSLVPEASDWSGEVEQGPFGPAHRLNAPVAIALAPMRWERPATQLGSSAPQW